MWKLLARLRQKSDIEKKSIAFIVALVVALMIFLSWVASFSFDNDDDANTEEQQVLKEEVARPVQLLKDQAGLVTQTVDLFSNIEE
jgi:hypothetical protein